MNNLARVLGDQGKREQAEEIHRQALRTEGDSAEQRVSIHTDEHEQPGVSTDSPGELRAGGRDTWTSPRAEGDGARQGES